MFEENATAYPVEEYKKTQSIERLSSTELLLNPSYFAQMTQLAKMLAHGSAIAIPNELKGKEGDCFLMVLQSVIWNINPMAVLSDSSVINGKLATGGKLAHSILVQSGAIQEKRLKPEYFGDWSKISGNIKNGTKTGKDGKSYAAKVPGWNDADEKDVGIKVYATLTGEDKPSEYKLYLSQCTIRNSPEWVTDPEQQIFYLATRKFIRRHCPWVLNGVYAKDELEEDVSPTLINLNQKPKTPIIDIKKEGVAASSEENPFFTKLANCKSVDEVEALRPDVSMMKGNVKAQAIAAFKEKKEFFTVPNPPTFEELKAQLVTGDIPEVLARANHLTVAQQAALKAEANAILDSMSEG